MIIRDASRTILRQVAGLGSRPHPRPLLRPSSTAPFDEPNTPHNALNSPLLPARPAEDFAALASARQVARSAQEADQQRRREADQKLRDLGWLDRMAAEEEAMQRLPRADAVVDPRDPKVRFSHRTIFGRMRPPVTFEEENVMRNRFIRTHGVWLPAFLQRRDGNGNLTFEVMTHDITHDFLRGRYSPRSAGKKLLFRGPLYHLLLMDHTMQSIVASERITARGVHTATPWTPWSRSGVPIPRSCQFAEAPLDSPVRTYVPIVPINGDLCPPLVDGSGWLYEKHVVAACDVQPYIVPPHYLSVNLAGRELYDKMTVADLDVPQGCIAHAGGKELPLLHIRPTVDPNADYDEDGFVLELIELD